MEQGLTLGDYGSWASIIGLAITGYTLWIVFHMKSRLLFKVNIDAHSSKISEMSSELTMSLGLFDQNKETISELLALVDVELRSIESGASGNLLNDVKIARKLIAQRSEEERSVRAIKMQLSVVLAELENHKQSFLIGD